MQILDNLIILSLIILSFVAGMKLADWNNQKASAERKDALEKQYLRLRAKMDEDDPVKPYKYTQPITPQFMNELRTKGKAKTAFRKSDLVR